VKIRKLTTYLVPTRWLFLKIDTDAGISGWGEPIVEGRAHTVRTAVEELADLLVGRDPRRIENLWQAMMRGAFYRGGPVLMSAIAGVDQALWDIKGKQFGVPAYELTEGGRGARGGCASTPGCRAARPRNSPTARARRSPGDSPRSR